MRYTKWHSVLGRYTVPCLFKEDGGRIEFRVYEDPGELDDDGKGRNFLICESNPHVFGEVIDRLAQLENLEEHHRKLLALPNCNECGHADKNTCGHRPMWGDTVRINCPLWAPKVEKLQKLELLAEYVRMEEERRAPE